MTPDPFALIGGLYQIPALLYVLAVILMFMYMNYGWPGVFFIIGGGILLFCYWRKKDQEAEYGF